VTRRTKKIVLLAVATWMAAVLGVQNNSLGAKEQSVAKAKPLQPQGLDSSGIYTLKRFDPSLTASGVKFAIVCRSITYIDGEPQNDYKPNINHNCFAKKRLIFHDDGELPAGISPHSTATCSILLGEDPNAFNPELGQFYFQAVAPQATADVYEFWQFLSDNVFGQVPPDANIVTAGVGSQFEDWWTRGIESLAEHYGLIVVAGIGNGLDARDPILYPAASANVIGVGVVDSVNTDKLATALTHFALAYPEHSSFGPTEDGRCKPDIVAAGNLLTADSNNPNRYEASGNWSSFSTPVVAGTIGLLVQKAKEDPNLALAVSPDGGNCVIKAILLNSATKLPYWHKGRIGIEDDHYVPMDYIQGAGMLNAWQAYRNLIAGPGKPNDAASEGWDLNNLEKEQTIGNSYKINLTEPNNKMITATLAWNRHYKSVYPFEPIPDRDNNLLLELWAVDINDPNNDYLLDYSDSNVDNIEHIYHMADANYTNYEIVVSYSGLKEPNQIHSDESYALAWNVSKSPTSDDNILWYDLNADGIVDQQDFTILLDNWLTSIKEPERYFLGDINADGLFDANDFQVLLNHKNQQADWYQQ